MQIVAAVGRAERKQGKTISSVDTLSLFRGPWDSGDLNVRRGPKQSSVLNGQGKGCGVRGQLSEITSVR